MKLLKTSSALLIALTTTTYTHAQLAGGHSFMKGTYVELGIDGPGAFEGAPWNEFSPPLPGFHYRSNTPFFGFVANPTMDGWAQFNGDFFTPGSNENGWGFTIDDGGTYFSRNNNCNYLCEIPFGAPNYSFDPVTGCMETQSAGGYTGSGYDFDINVDYLLKINDLYYTTTVTITNNSGQSIDNFYYFRTVDPDNNADVDWPLVGDYSTTNTIMAQPTPTCGRAHVSATSPSPWPSYMGFAGIGQEFRVSRGSFSVRDGKQIWDGTGDGTSWGSPIGSGSSYDDAAISIAYRIQNFAPGETRVIKFVVILDDAAATAAINNLFYFEYEGSLGGPPAECTIYQDSVTSCTGNPVILNVSGPVLTDFNWTWSPAIGLSSTTGTSVSANPPSATTYTVTGTPATPCYTSNIVQTVYVDIVEGPDVSYVDPGPQCISFNLSALDHSDANSVPGAVTHFYTVPPLTLADTAANLYTGATITPTSPDVYVVYYDPAEGCIDYELVDIEWGSLGANLSVVHPDCGFSNGEITVNVSSATPGATYTYALNGAPAVTTNTFTGLAAGAYSIQVEDGLGCVATLDTTLQVSNSPVPTLTSALTSCTYTCDGTITVAVTGGTAPFNYAIAGGPSQTSNVLTGLCPAAYTVTVTDDVGCTANATISVGTPAPFTITAGPGSTVCIGQTATVSATTTGGAAPITFNWSHSLPSAPSNTVDPEGTTTYTVTATDNNGCNTSNTGSIIVVENPALNVNVSSAAAVCPGDAATISATAGGGNGGPYTYVWSNNQNATILTGASQTVNPTVTTIYTVSATDNCGTPAATATVTVTVHPIPAITFTADKVEGCTPVMVTFTNTTGALSGNACTWEFGDGSTSAGCVINHVFSAVGCFDVTLHDVTTNGCEIDTTVTAMICSYPIPQPEFSWSPNAPDVFNPEVFFENLTVGGITYEWNIGGMDNSTLTNPSYTFPADSAGTYEVCLTATSDHGCVDSTCHFVVINGQLILYAPNAFTPDGNGVNDVFIPIIHEEDPQTYELTIFNRWGQVVFKTTNTTTGWDGTHNGVKAKEDVYVWKVTVKERVNSEKHEFNGHVTLLR